MGYEQILSEQRGDVLLLTLNRPERLNAWTPKMSAELTDAIKRANDDRSIGAIVVTGAGRGFCAGADIGSQFAPGVEAQEKKVAPEASSGAVREGFASRTGRAGSGTARRKRCASCRSLPSE